jgi:hypothetical protein
MYQTQTVIVKNLNVVAASRCPARCFIIYTNKLIQENTYIYPVQFRLQKSENITELAAL